MHLLAGPGLAQAQHVPAPRTPRIGVDSSTAARAATQVAHVRVDGCDRALTACVRAHVA